jgi:hypothetical protein
MPDKIQLSESAVATLRFRIKGYRMPVNERRLPAFRELAAAGIMEPDGEDYRFTADGWARREEILRMQEERIERERYAPPDGRLSVAARERLRRYLAGDRRVTDEDRPAFRELVEARVMIPVHTFVGGREAEFRLTYWGHERRFELAGIGAKESA